MSATSVVRAYRMFRSDSTAETVAAVALVLILFGPMAIDFLRHGGVFDN